VDALKAADSRYYVDFDSQGGSAITSALVLKNGLLTAPSAPTKSGFVFNGWFKQSECTTPWNFSTDRVNADTTLYAKWSYGVTLTSSNTTYGTVSGGGLYQPGTTITVTATPKPGYCFTGWTEGEANTSSDPSYAFTAERNIALRANFIRIETPVATATLQTYASTRIEWSSVPYAAGYELARATSSTGTYTVIATLDDEIHEYTDIVSTSGVTYYYKVRAFCLADAVRTTGSYSAYVSAKPQWPAMSLSSATLMDYHDASLVWTSVANADGYAVYRSTSSSSGFAEIATDLIGTTYLDIGLPVGKTYYYKVRPFILINANKVYGPYTSYKYVTPKWPSITLAASTLDYRSVNLVWTDVPDVDGYEVSRMLTSTGTPVMTKFVEDHSYVDSDGLTLNRVYYYKVRAYDTIGDAKVFGPYCTYKSAKAAWPSITLTARTQTYNSIRLTWNTVAGADGYEVQRSLSTSSTSFLPVTEVTEGAYTDEGLDTNKTYYYKVRPYDETEGGKVYGPVCTYKYARTAWPSITLTARTQTYNSIRLTWNTVAGADGYEVQRSLSTSTTSFLPVTEVTEGAYTDEGLDTNKTYYYKVRPFDEIEGVKVYGPLCTYKYARTAWPSLTLTARTRSYTSISLSWNTVTGADAYEIERSLSSSVSTFTPLAEVSDETSYIDFACESGKTYYYRVRAVDYIGVGDKAKGPFCTVRYAKASWPTLTLTAVSQNHRSIRLNWNALDGIQGYQVWRNTAATGTFTHVASVEGAPGLLDDGSDGLDANRTYYYKIRAYNGADVGAFSSVKSARTAWKAFTVTAVSTGYINIRVSWNEISRAQGYNVYRATSSGGTYVKLNTEDIADLFYTDKGLTTGTTYYYKVEAFDTVRGVRIFSPRSAYKSAKPLTTAPTGLVLENASSTSIALSWDAVEGATGYEVYRATSLSGTYTRIATPTEAAALSSGLTTGRTYYYKVRAYTRVGTTNYFGPYCAVLSKKAQAVPL
jgi:uncharacterized repeat protein (TIGR02543 family)